MSPDTVVVCSPTILGCGVKVGVGTNAVDADKTVAVGVISGAAPGISV